MAKLAEYRRKRRFDRTPEPSGKGTATKKKSTGSNAAVARSAGAYLIQKHAARRLHYDLRLELDGVLLSWAVPKGPSRDPTQRRLAVHVEDHPVEYGAFEGTIPQGEYGGGTVMLWDRGTWEPLEDPHAGLTEGHLKFLLKGERLKGAWSLIRISGRGSDGEEEGDNWLLIKGKDRYASTRDLLTANTSVTTRRTMDEIARANDAPWKSNRKPARTESMVAARLANAAQSADNHKPAAQRPRTNRTKTPTAVAIHPSTCPDARRATQPKEFHPQLATLVTRVPEGSDWLHELKLDGYRLLCFIEDGQPRLVSRNGNDWSSDFPTIVYAAGQLAVKNAILDGEAVVLRPDGTTNFQALQNSVKDRTGKPAAIRYFIFDLPHCEGYDLTRTPLIERKNVLKGILAASTKAGPTILYSEHVAGEGEKIFQIACSHAMEGVVSKKDDAPYEQRRTKSWLKIKCIYEQEFVIGGFTDPRSSREGLGALLVGFYQGKDLVFAGRVGTGFTETSLKSLRRQLSSLEIDRPAFSNPPKGANANGVHWIRPELVAEVEFNEWTREGLLRHPSFKGLRLDKDPGDVVRERPRKIPEPREDFPETRPRDRQSTPMKSKIDHRKSTRKAPRVPKAKAQTQFAGVTITNPDRVLYPEQGITKAELARFYESIADYAVPHMNKRPLSLVRCPTGRQGSCFYQKHLSDQIPGGLGTVPIREKSATRQYVYIKNLTGLVGLVQIGVLEIHPWGCRADEVEKPDRLVFDLDPGPGAEWSAVIAGAKRVREMLQAVKLDSFLKTSGGKGLHVVAPIARTVSWDELKEFAHGIVLALAGEEPDRYLTVMTKARRKGKVFLDYLRNSRGATCVAAYSTRARENAPVSTPIFWEELNARLRPDRYTVRNLPDRLRNEKDPWKEFLALRQTLTTTARRAVKELAKSGN